MSDAMNEARSLFELQQLEAAIKSELDLNSQVLPCSSEVPITTLAIELEADAKGRSRIASLIFIPLDESDVETLKLLQFYCETPIKLEDDLSRSAIIELLPTINLKIPLGSFCLDSQNQVVFKYVNALGKSRGIDPEEFLETLLLWMFTLDSMSVLIDSVVTSECSLQSAMQALMDDD
ncbi:MAG: YbjN domain-containing protein [Spirulina sp.]